MGFIKSVKTDIVATDAAKARKAGRRVFTPVFNTPASRQNGMSGAIDDWAAMVDAVEAEGWKMVEWSVAHDAKGRPEAYPVFRVV